MSFLSFILYYMNLKYFGLFGIISFLWSTNRGWGENSVDNDNDDVGDDVNDNDDVGDDVNDDGLDLFGCSSFVGSYVNDRKEGEGILYYPDGSRYSIFF